MILSVIPWPLFVGFVSGIVFLLLVQVTIIYLFFFRNPNNQSNISAAPSVDGYTFPQQLYEFLAEKLGENNSEGTLLLNLLLQFWFRENRYDVNTLTALANKINFELTELLTNTPLGRIFNSLKIHDIELGSESPTISCVRLVDVDVNKELNTLNNFVFEFDVNYRGGFYTAIHALMKFNSNTAFVSIKVNKCIGRIRVEFTRVPYTYWCMSFLSPPDLDLVVESRLEGHSVPQLNRIIGIQLRRRINRRFVMPFYKIRSKPFLPAHNLINVKDDISESIPPGKLHITVVSMSRIAKREGDISCMLILDSSPWIEDVQSTTNHTYLLHIFRRSNKDLASLENRKLSTGSLLFDRNQDGLRQRLKSMTGQDDSGSLDESVRRKSFADPSMLQQKSCSDILVRAESDDGTNIQQTKRIPYSELIMCNEQFKFTIGPAVRYLTMLVLNHPNDGQPENIIGHVSIPLTNLIHPGIGRKRRIFYLNSPNQTKNMSYATLATHPGFNGSLCYGDITLGVKFTSLSSSASAPSLSSNESTPVSLSPTNYAKPPILLETTASLSCIDSEMILSAHEFDRMVITKPTRCEFCQKKIWLREASRCQKCNLVCHKKCVAKCEKSSECRGYVSEDSVTEEDGIEMAAQAISINPEITTTAPDNGGVSRFSGSGRNKLSTFFANVKGMRRSGSTSSLAPPSNVTVCFSQVHSLPQTPNHSPCPSRKSSVVINDVKLFESEVMEDEIETALNHLTTLPQSEQFLESVKTSGKKLCMDLPPHERQSRINGMIAKIKMAIDMENTSARSFEEQKKQTNDVEELTKLSFQIGKCEERLQALTNLLLHCCSGLQDSQEASTKTTDVLL